MLEQSYANDIPIKYIDPLYSYAFAQVAQHIIGVRRPNATLGHVFLN
jgi:hypothetical protein